MNTVEHLLTCLAEECAEVQQAIAKAQRFGLEDGYPGTDRTNAGDLAKEFGEVIAVAEMLQDMGVIEAPKREDIAAKKERVMDHMGYAFKRGTLGS